MQPISENLKNAICETWGAIAPDCEHCEDDEGRMEMVIDADRLMFFTKNAEAEAEVKALITAHGYPKTLKHLSKQVALYY